MTAGGVKGEKWACVALPFSPDHPAPAKMKAIEAIAKPVLMVILNGVKAINLFKMQDYSLRIPVNPTLGKGDLKTP